MAFFIRVDDRLIHGQTMCAWVPYVEATSLVVASDKVAADKVKSSIMTNCCFDEIPVCVKSVEELLTDENRECLSGDRVLLIVADLKDAMRLFEGGVKFDSVNIGNLHYTQESKRISRTVSFDIEDEKIINEFIDKGVAIDIREVPDSQPQPLSKGEGS